jgi:hypothetical protein
VEKKDNIFVYRAKKFCILPASFMACLHHFVLHSQDMVDDRRKISMTQKRIGMKKIQFLRSCQDDSDVSCSEAALTPGGSVDAAATFFLPSVAVFAGGGLTSTSAGVFCPSSSNEDVHHHHHHQHHHLTVVFYGCTIL